MQVYVNKKLMGEIPVKVMPGATFVEFVDYAAIAETYSAGTFDEDGGYDLCEEPVRHRFPVAPMQCSVAIPEHANHNADLMREVAKLKARHNVPDYAVLTSFTSASKFETQHRFSWTVIEVPQDKAELIFDMNDFIPV